MHLAINTGSLSLDTRQAIAEVHALGFTAVEVNLQQAELAYGFDQTPNLAFYGELARELKLRKLTVTGVHALFLNAAQMFSAQARRAVLAVEGEVTRLLGAEILVVHPTDILESEEWLDLYCDDARMPAPLVESIVSVIRELQSGGVRIALENVQHWRGTCGTNDAETMARLVMNLAVTRRWTCGAAWTVPASTGGWSLSATASPCITCTTRWEALNITRRLLLTGGTSSRSSSARPPRCM